MEDQLGNRMKEQYERRWEILLPRRTFTILRIDGKCFYSYTRNLEKPFDKKLAENLDAAAVSALYESMGARFAYGQSDEYSFLLSDFDSPKTEAWFGGVLQKIVSIATSVFTAAFNQRALGSKPAHFDCRAFIIPDPVEVENYFIWRQQDATRNSINMAACCHYSHQQLLGKSSSEKQEMLFQKGVNWNDYPAWARRGRIIKRQPNIRTVTFTHKKTGQQESVEVSENPWTPDWDIPVFTKDRAYLRSIVPLHEAWECPILDTQESA